MTRPRVLVTRAREDAAPLVAALAAAGLDAVVLPLLAYEFLDKADEIRAAVARGVRWIAISSPRAVPAVAALEPWPAGVRLAAVGAVTAAALAERSLNVEIVGDGDGAAGLVRAFARLDPPESAADSLILWLTGNLAGDELRIGLRRLGFEVAEIEVYRTIVATPVPAEVGLALEDLSAAVFASPSAVRAFVAAAPPAWLEAARATLNTIAIGTTTEGELVRAGFKRRRVAAQPSPEGLAQAAARALEEKT